MLPAAPTGPPVAALTAIQFGGSIHDFNDRLAAVVAAHAEAHGTRPSPGIALDVARSPVPVHQFVPLFSGAKTALQARARQAVSANPLEAYSGADYVAGIKSATAAGMLDGYMKNHGDDIAALAQKDKSFAAKLRPVLAYTNPRLANGPVQLQGIGTPNRKGVLGILDLAASQIVQGVVHSPGAMVGIAKTIYKGDKGVFTGNDQQITEANAEFGTMVKGTVASVKQDVLHPSERPGFLFLDVLGLAAPATRLAAGGRAILAGEGLNAAELAVTKKAGGTMAIGREGAKENVLLSDNPAVAALQRWNNNRRQSNLEAAVTGDSPAGLRSILVPKFAQDFLDKNFSFERKIGRESDARQRVQHIVDTSLGNELNHVAGGVATYSTVLGRLTDKLRGGLNRGEKKAIQTLSFGVSPDNQISTIRDLIDAGIGSAKDHTRQIADLGLAKKVLNNDNPSERFSRAVELTQQVVAQTQRKKIDDLGLSPLTAEARVSKPAAIFADAKTVARRNQLKGALAKLQGIAKNNPEDAKLQGQIAKYQTELDGLANPLESPPKVGAQTYPATGTVEPFYTKLETGKPRTPVARGGYFASRPGRFGEGPAPLPAELKNELTGSSIVNGKYSIDATGLATQGMARTFRAANVLAEHDKHWNAGTDLPRSKWDMPVRDKRSIPEGLRNALNALEDNVISPAEADRLPDDMRDVLKELYVSPDDFAKQYGELSAITEPIPGIKFFDRRSAGSASSVVAPASGRGAMKVMEVINEPFRDLTLFVRPAYALNALGNGAMLAFDEGFAAVPNVAWALRAKSALGEEAYRVLVNLGGTGKAGSYATEMSLKPGRMLASGWNVLTDRVFRSAAIRHYAREMGYKTDAEFKELLLSGGKDLVEAARRGNKSLVEFDNMTAVERDYFRHIVFVYPWVSRSVVYSLRAVMQYPARTDLLAHLGDQEANSDPIFNHVPEWFKKTGYFPIGWNADGTPRVVNPTSINTFSTLSDLMGVAQAGVSGSKYDSVAALFGPAATFFLHATSGRDEFGNKYPGSQWLGAAQEVIAGLPQVSAFARSSKVNPPVKPVDVTKRASLEASFNSSLKRVVFSPGWLGGFGSLIIGGLSSRTEDPQAAAARYWRDQTPAARHGLELDFLNRALNMQGELLRQKIPGKARNGVKVASDLTYAYSKFSTENGRTPTLKEKANLTLDYFTKKGSLDLRKAFEYKKALSTMVDPTEIQSLINKAVDDHGDGKAVKQWDSDVRLVASFKAPVFAEKMGRLAAQGVISAAPKASQSALYEYGRKYLAFTNEAKALGEKVKAGKALPAELRAFEDLHDVPVNGLPSFVRTAWGYNTPAEQKQATMQAIRSSWTSLSGFEKELLGQKVDAKVSEGWAAYAHYTSPEFLATKYLVGERTLDQAQRAGIIKQLDTAYKLNGSLTKDYTLSRQPRFQRYQQLNIYKQSPNKQNWKDLFERASELWAASHSATASITQAQMRDAWSEWAAKVVPVIQQTQPKFYAELKPYLDSNPRFLAEMVSR